MGKDKILKIEYPKYALKVITSKAYNPLVLFNIFKLDMTKHLNENRIQGKFGSTSFRLQIWKRTPRGDITALSMAITLAESTILENEFKRRLLLRQATTN